MTPRHFLDLFKLEPATLRLLVDEARRRKAARGPNRPAAAPDDDAPAAGRALRPRRA